MVQAIPTPFAVAPGQRVYAVGDVHGCWSQLQQLLAEIRRDNDPRPPAQTRILLLGDVVDRGPDSRQVVEHLMRYTKASSRFTVLMGNHEQLMSAALGGDARALRNWLAVGGDATLRSWGVAESLLASAEPGRLIDAARVRVGVDVALWLEQLPLRSASGDVVFVHAGVRPGVPLDAQSIQDLLWIRAPFLESEEERPFLVVHGHSVARDGPDIRGNRIGLDTGASRGGRLTAMAFEDRRCWVLST